MSELHDTEGEREEQLLITTDQNGKPTGTDTRKNCHTRDGKTHLAFMAILYGREGMIYLQKRSQKKSLWDTFWDGSVVSHVLPGETVEEACNRRGKEELGVEVEFVDRGAFYYFAKYGNNCENEYCHVLVGVTDKVIHPNPVEIEEIKEQKFDDLKKDIQENPNQYTPWLKIAVEKIDLSKPKEIQ